MFKYSQVSFLLRTIGGKNFNISKISNLKSFIVLVFILIIIINYSGLIPFGFCFSTQPWFRLWLSLSLFFISFFLIFRRRLRSFFRRFIPSGSSLFLGIILFWIELVSCLIRPITLSLRLLANIVAGHVLINLISSTIVTRILIERVTFIIWITLGLIFIFFEIFVCFIQSVVFFLLVNRYIRENE